MRFGKEDTAKELQDHAADTQDTLVDAGENAEVRSRPRGTSFFDLRSLLELGDVAKTSAESAA